MEFMIEGWEGVKRGGGGRCDEGFEWKDDVRGAVEVGVSGEVVWVTGEGVNLLLGEEKWICMGEEDKKG